MIRHPAHLLTDAGTWLARPAAFLVVVAYVAVWLIFDRASFNWHEILTLATLCMTLFIQRSEHRDMQAVHANSMNSCVPTVRGAPNCGGWTTRSRSRWR